MRALAGGQFTAADPAADFWLLFAGELGADIIL